MSSNDSNRVTSHLTAEDLVIAALSILQRGLPPGDLNDRQVVTELWGIFDNPQSRIVIERASATLSPGLLRPAGDRE
jgi:hypothetical protein